jgi:hypothetical protein
VNPFLDFKLTLKPRPQNIPNRHFLSLLAPNTFSPSKLTRTHINQGRVAKQSAIKLEDRSTFLPSL